MLCSRSLIENVLCPLSANPSISNTRRFEMYPCRCQRQWAKDAVETCTGERHAPLKNPLPCKTDPPLDVVVVNACLIAAIVICAGAHLNDLVFIDLAPRARASRKVFQTGQKNSAKYKCSARSDEGDQLTSQHSLHCI